MEKVVKLFSRIQFSLESTNYGYFILKPKQVTCLENLLNGRDVLAVLPTGFGKSLLFHLLPTFLPIKSVLNIILVVTPLNSIIKDQVHTLRDKGITAGVLQTERLQTSTHEKLFETEEDVMSPDTLSLVDQKIVDGKISIVFAHPESVLNDEGRKILTSPVYQNNVVACVIDEAHCVEMW